MTWECHDPKHPGVRIGIIRKGCSGDYRYQGSAAEQKKRSGARRHPGCPGLVVID
jgi:hypothetical protein